MSIPAGRGKAPACLVPYYGSKRQLAPLIVELLGKHSSYLEPFCGSLAVLLAKTPCPMEVANDLSGDLVNLARVVADDRAGPELFGRLSRTAFCQRLHADSASWLSASQGGEGVDRAYHYFVVSWMGRNGLAGTAGELSTGFCKRNTSRGGDPAVRFRNAVDAIPSWWRRLRGVTILSEDGIGLLEKFEDRETAVVYADPPYLEKSARYRHDFSPADHERLAAALGRFGKTRCVLSYYDHPCLADLYPGWEVVRPGVRQNMSVRSGSREAPEVVLVNRVKE